MRVSFHVTSRGISFSSLSSRFRWVFCQLETLRRSVQRNLRGILEKLPKTLDETYEQILKNINEDNREHARRFLHCLAVAIRPLLVEELAEILTFDFDGAQGSIPKFHADWRSNDQEEAVLSTCSSLIAVVDSRDEEDHACRVVQFSHFSVKEFLISDRLASSSPDVSRYHILPGPAHTILAQACLGFLLHLDEPFDWESANLPLARYAAEHWVAHAQFDDIASLMKDGMQSLFDPNKLHLVRWLEIYDIDLEPNELGSDTPNPLYYASFCGFHDLVEHLVLNHPQLVNVNYGMLEFPLLAALSGKHIRVAEFLLRHGGTVGVRGWKERTPLHIAIAEFWGLDTAEAEAVLFLLKHGADVNSRDGDFQTPLHIAAACKEEPLETIQLLLECGADIDSNDASGKTPLHLACTRAYDGRERGDVAQLLLERGASVNERDNDHATPLVVAVHQGNFEPTRILLEHGAEPNVKNNNGKTLLHLLLTNNPKRRWPSQFKLDMLRLTCLLLEHGANVNEQDNDHTTPLHLAMKQGWYEVAQILLEHGAEPNVANKDCKTPLHLVFESIPQDYDRDDIDTFFANMVRLLLERGADLNARDKDYTTPLHLAMEYKLYKMVQILLENTAEPNVVNKDGETPLHLVFEAKLPYYHRYDLQVLISSAVRLLLERGADVNARDKSHTTPVRRAIQRKMYDIARVLLNRGAEPNVTDDGGNTPLHLLLGGDITYEDDIPGLVRLLLERGADVNAQDQNHATPLLLAMERHWFNIARILLDYDAGPNVKRIKGKTPLHLLLEPSIRDYDDTSDVQVVAKLLLERGADVYAQDENNTTPLYLAHNNWRFEISKIIIEHANAEKCQHQAQMYITPEGEYNSLEQCQHFTVSLERGTDVNPQNMDPITDLHCACYFGRFETTRVLLNHGANVNTENVRGETPLHIVSRGQYDSQDDGVSVVQLLLGRGANVNAQDKDHMTPLHLASYSGKLDIVQVLLRHGASVNTKGELGQTALHLALDGNCSGQDSLGIVRLLLEHGADVNCQDGDNITPLHLSCNYGKLAIGRVLLIHGANPNAANMRGQTPLHMLSIWSWNDVDECCLVGELMDGGADVNARDKDHETPLHTAYRNNRLDIAQCLIRKRADKGALNDNGETPIQLAPRLTATE